MPTTPIVPTVITVGNNGTRTINQSETDTVQFLGAGTLYVTGTAAAPITVTLSQITNLNAAATLTLSYAHVILGGVATGSVNSIFNIGEASTLELQNVAAIGANTTFNFTGNTGSFVVTSVYTPTNGVTFNGFGPGKTFLINNNTITSATFADNVGSNTGGILTLYNGTTAVDTLAFTNGDFATRNFGLVTTGGNTLIQFNSYLTNISATPDTATVGLNGVVNITITMSNPISITGGVPTLALNDGGTAVYNAAASTSTAIVYTYVVGAGQNTADLAVTGTNLNGAIVAPVGGGGVDTLGVIGNLTGTLVVDTIAPIVTSTVISQPNGILAAGSTVAFTLGLSEAVTVGSGTPVLVLNDGGTAAFDRASSTATSLVFKHTVQSGQNSPDLAVVGASLNGATIGDLAGNPLSLAGAIGNPAGTLVVDTLAPTVTSVTTSPGSGSLVAGQTATFSVAMSEPVFLAGGTPSLALNDGGIAVYDPANSTTTMLVFKHVIQPGQNAADLAVIGSSLNGATIADLAGNALNLNGAIGNPLGLLAVGNGVTSLISTTGGTVPTGTTPITTGTGSPTATLSVYRFFDSVNGTHFYTTSLDERNAILQTRHDLVSEGVGLRSIDPAANDSNAREVFRFFDTLHGTQFLTSSTAERDTILSTRPDLTFEPSGSFYEHIQQQAGDTAVYRFFSTNDGTHFYTDSKSELASILQNRPDLVSEGVGFYEPG